MHSPSIWSSIEDLSSWVMISTRKVVDQPRHWKVAPPTWAAVFGGREMSQRTAPHSQARRLKHCFMILFTNTTFFLKLQVVKQQPNNQNNLESFCNSVGPNPSWDLHKPADQLLLANKGFPLGHDLPWNQILFTHWCANHFYVVYFSGSWVNI